MIDVNQDFSLWGLFLSAFISATLFPGGSEAVLAYLATQSTHNTLTLLSIATLGNTLGGMSSYFLGWLLSRWRPENFGENPRHNAAIKRLRSYGSPMLLLSWLPVVGDPLCLAAGWLRLSWLWSLVFITLGKAGRYVVVVGFFN